MSERPTPETDAFSVKFKSVCGSKAWVPVDVAARLERERDAAIAECKSLWSLVNSNKIKWKQAERERDEALSKVEQQRKEIVRLNGATNHAGGTPLKIALKERDKLKQAIIATLENNRHLADGDDCTLAKLKSVVPEWK